MTAGVSGKWQQNQRSLACMGGIGVDKGWLVWFPLSLPLQVLNSFVHTPRSQSVRFCLSRLYAGGFADDSLSEAERHWSQPSNGDAAVLNGIFNWSMCAGKPSCWRTAGARCKAYCLHLHQN